MKPKFSKTESKNKIDEFFSRINDRTPKEIKKIKKLAMNQKISLKEYKKVFCKYCFVSFSGKEKIRIKSGIKSITCNNCNKVSRWKMK